MWKIKKETIILILIELTSAICGLIGVVLGILSLFSLNPDVWQGDNESREHTSFIFTSLTVFFDSLSTSTAIIAFKYGGLIIKRKKANNEEINIAEKFANKLDLYSFFFGLVGLILSILSLLFLFPFLKTNPGSEIATILSVISDSISALIVIWVILILIKINKK